MGKIVVKLLVVLVLSLCIGLVWQNYDSKKIQISSFDFKKKSNYKKTVQVRIISNLGSSSLLKMDIAIPCKDRAQCSDLTQNMPKMKSALLTKMDQGDMARLIEDRDFDTIKKIYLGVVNRYAENPVDAIYIESFNY